MSTELQSLKSDILTKCSELEEKCDALAQKYTSLEDRVFNNEACLGEVEEANAASDMKFGTLDSEIESLKKEIDRLEGFRRRDNLGFFGLGPEIPVESFPVCFREVVAALNDGQNPIKHWTEEVISSLEQTALER